MERFVTKFWTEEDGNTTLDWMVLTAGLVLLGAAVLATIGQPEQSFAQEENVIVASETSTGV